MSSNVLNALLYLCFINLSSLAAAFTKYVSFCVTKISLYSKTFCFVFNLIIFNVAIVPEFNVWLLCFTSSFILSMCLFANKQNQTAVQILGESICSCCSDSCLPHWLQPIRWGLGAASANPNSRGAGAFAARFNSLCTRILTPYLDISISKFSLSLSLCTHR